MTVNVRNLLIFSHIPGVGPTRLRALITYFKDPSLVMEATAKELAAVEGIERKTALSIVSFCKNGVPARVQRQVDEQLSRLNRVGGRAVTVWDKEYPENLKKIYDPPPVIFLRGTLSEHDKFSIAIVGTRTPSPYGTQMAERFSADLSKLGIPIVSGLARGIDTCAHNAALKSRGRTIAVMGSGIDIIYPPENRQLVEHILGDGAVMSEFEMGTKPDAQNFPRRNRIVSGIALATLIVETGVDGGAMITASTALDQNREIFAIPSAVSGKRSSGTNLLIKEGKAKLTENIEDILSDLRHRLKAILKEHEQTAPSAPRDLSLFEQQLFDALGDDPVHIDVLAQRAKVPISDALVHLLSLEFKGAVKQLRGKIFVKT